MVLTGFTIASLFLTIVFGFQYRMVKQPLGRKMGQALMNIFMGITLILFSINQYLFPDLTTIRIVIASLLLFLGGVNLVMGLKNYRYYKGLVEKK
ncbi:YtpI family protein [Ammoniphilus sp. CFH 90114]|uniref:YtpI family protein n=1 Tax=Ammoniphilus sp. CFH 90114 TaxID=2493665 RepID=UPI00100F1960|nr:YtpI family protein [Ammoniphilus sp. CFH 90114]RXT04795.1 hypothetical protein EIZ39_18890 [Ammoniphilus sp. CFH 90114]